MNSHQEALSRTLAVVLMLSVVLSTTVAGVAVPQSSPQSVDGDFTFSALDTASCVTFESGFPCTGGDLTNSATVRVTKITTPEIGKLKLTVEPTAVSGYSDDDYSFEARVDNGAWSDPAALNAGTAPVLVENDYLSGSIQYPTIYVRVTDSTGSVVAQNALLSPLPYSISAGNAQETFQDASPVNESSSSSRNALVIGNEFRDVQEPTYSGVSRFNDGDPFQESFEDKSIPPVRYSDGGAKIAGATGNVLYFENLREGAGFPAIFSHDARSMNLGTAIYGIPGGEYQSIRIDYGLQTETVNQYVQVNLVDGFGNPIDNSVVDSPTRRLTQTTERGGEYFDNKRQYSNALYEDNLQTDTLKFQLTSEERQYVANNNNLYLTYETNDRAYLLLYRTPIISQSIENEEGQNFVPDEKYFETAFNKTGGNESVSTFAEFADYDIKGSLNDAYQSFDKTPGENVQIQVRVENVGDQRVERQIGIYSMSENNQTLYGEDATPRIIEERTIAVEPRSSKTVTVEYAYEGYEYGNHSVSVIDITENDNPIPLNRKGTEETSSKVYVLQPATFEVKNVITPSSWLIYDNFDTTVTVENVGDLDGDAVLRGEFQDWSGTLPIPETKGGDVRANASGEVANVTFDSRNYQYSPSYPERPETPTDRPNSPYGSSLTFSDNSDPDVRTDPDVDSRFSATTFHPFAEPNSKLQESINNTKTTEQIRIYKLDIITMTVEGERDNTDIWYASGHEYATAVQDPYIDAWKFATDYDIYEEPIGSMPSLEQTQYLFPLYKVGDAQNPLDARVLVRNSGQAPVGDARVVIRTDKIGYDGSQPGIVGTGGLEDIPPFQTAEVRVPVVIRNDVGNGGVHTLTADVRTEPDYIQQVTLDADSPGGVEQFRTTVNTRLWADFLHIETTTDMPTVNEACTGVNPSDSISETVDCATGLQEDFVFQQVHQNVGGVDGPREVFARIYAHEDPTGASNYFNIGAVSNPWNGVFTGNAWDQQEVTIEAGTTHSYTATLPIDEPGIYSVRSAPVRTNNIGELTQYKNWSFTPPEKHLYFKVLDITTPEPDYYTHKNRFECKSGTCYTRNGPNTVWEGGMVGFTDDSVDNVMIEWRQWEGTINYNGGDTTVRSATCAEADHCYSSGSYPTDRNAVKSFHRFQNPGQETVTLRVRDAAVYGAGAGPEADSLGTPNEATQSWTWTVDEDQNDPNAGVYLSDRINSDSSPDGTTLWHSYGPTNYDGIETCFTSSATDAEIGIEADSWSNNMPGSANQDTRCRTWGPSYTGPNTVTYEAWDFSGRSDTATSTFTIETDTKNPSASLSVSSDSPYYSVPSRGYTNDVRWRGSADDDETGIRSASDGCGYTWAGDRGSQSPSCSDSFNTYYTSSGTKEMTFTVEDYHGNTKSATETIRMERDTTAPSVSGAFSTSASGSDSGVGLWKVTGYVSSCVSSGDVRSYDCDLSIGSSSASIDVKVRADSASVPSGCGSDSDSTSASASGFAQITFHDYHGNTETVTIDDSDYDSDYASQDPCPPPPDDGDSRTGL